MYILAIIAALSFAGGFALSYEIYTGEIHALNAAIEMQNQQVDMMLDAAKKRVIEAQKTAIETNKQLDSAHEQKTAIINDYSNQLDRLRAENKRRRGSAMSSGDSARIYESTAEQAEFCEEFERLVYEKAAIADISADYAEQAYHFTTINNCGIPR